MEKIERSKILFVDEEKIEYLGDIAGEMMHSEILEEYIQSNFKDHSVLGKLNYKTGANSLAYALAYFKKKIIILNATKLDENSKIKHGTIIYLVVPSNISEKLKYNLFSLSEFFQNFSNFYVEKAEVVDNILEGIYIPIECNLSIEEKLKSLINQVNNIDSPKR